MGTFQTGIVINKGISTNGTPLAGQDYISGLVLYGTAPASFPSAGYKQMFSVQDAINVGITGNSTDETQAVGDLVMSSAASAGLTLNVYVQEPVNPLNTNTNPNKVLLCTYTTVTADSTAGTFATNVAAAINANQATTGGYTALATSTSVAITARKGLGVALNTGTPISVTGTASGDAAITQFASGVASTINNWYYHISEYFRMNPNGQLWVSITSAPSTAFIEVQTLQVASQGQIRQMGIYAPSRAFGTYGTSDIVALQAIATTLDSNKMPVQLILAEDITAVSDLSTLTNLSLQTANYVSVNISQDGAAQGWALYKAYGKSITNLGALLGCVSLAPVSQDIAQPIPSFNISNGTENNLVAFANNTLFSAVSTGLQTQLDNYRYIYTGNYVGYVGTYFNDSHCAIISNSNYAYIEQNRVQQKIERLMYQAYLPIVKSQITLNADGTIYIPLVYSLQSVGDNTLTTNMVSKGELSAVRTVINPLQNITTQGGLVVTLYEINNPIARTITINVNSVSSIPTI